MKPQWIPKNVSDGMPKSVPAHIHIYIGFLVKLKKVSKLLYFEHILKDAEAKHTRSGYLSVVYLCSCLLAVRIIHYIKQV